MKLALGIEYNGYAYYGWQRQREVPSVQGYLENALSKVADESIIVYCAGRTDSGVHATGQVIHFETKSRRPDSAWILGVNANLPIDISVRWVVSVPEDFHARFCATARRYRYVIYNNRIRPSLFFTHVYHYHQSLDVQKMSRASQYLLGEHDFSSFRSLQCQSRSPWRYLYHLWVIQKREYIIVDIKANAFVHHMVRNIIGSLIEVGRGNQPEIWISELLAQRDRTLSVATVPAEGLYLSEVDYPSRFGLPSSSLESSIMLI